MPPGKNPLGFGLQVPKPTPEIGPLSKKVKMAHEKALAEDASVFEYDEVYETFQREDSSALPAPEKQKQPPKYINALLNKASMRERENERFLERRIQKEREKENGEFDDKEKFVTSAYKKKMEEMRALEQQEKEKDELERRNDPSKTGNMHSFYRNLLNRGHPGGDHSDASSRTSKPTSSGEMSHLDSNKTKFNSDPKHTESKSPSKHHQVRHSSVDRSKDDREGRSRDEKSRDHREVRSRDEKSRDHREVRSRDEKSRDHRESRSRDHRESRSRDEKSRDYRESRSRDYPDSRSRDDRKELVSKGGRGDDSKDARLDSKVHKNQSPPPNTDQEKLEIEKNNLLMEEKIKKAYQRRNGMVEIEAARARYLARKASKLVPLAFAGKV